MLTREDAEFLIGSADDPEYRALLTCMFFTGARVSEVMALTWNSIDFARLRIRFRLAIRNVDQWRSMHPRVAEVLSRLPRNPERVFRWRHTKIGPEKPLRRLRAKTGIPFTYKMARYSFASWLADDGTSIKDIMDTCGWASANGPLGLLAYWDEWNRRIVETL